MPPAGALFQVCTSSVANRARKFRIDEKQSQRSDIIKSKRDKDAFAMAVIEAKLKAGFYALSFQEQFIIDKQVVLEDNFFVKSVQLNCEY